MNAPSRAPRSYEQATRAGQPLARLSWRVAPGGKPHARPEPTRVNHTARRRSSL